MKIKELIRHVNEDVIDTEAKAEIVEILELWEQRTLDFKEKSMLEVLLGAVLENYESGVDPHEFGLMEEDIATVKRLYDKVKLF